MGDLCYKKAIKFFDACFLKKFSNKEIVIDDVYYIHEKIQHAREFKKYLMSINLKNRIIKKSNGEKPIGIILLPYEWGDWYQFSINLAVMLYLEGYNVELVVDDLPCAEEEYICQGINAVSVTLIKYILRVFDKSNISVFYMSSCSKTTLNNMEYVDVERVFNESVLWLKAHNKRDITRNYKDIFFENAEYIKNFVFSDKYMSVNIYTGLHFEKGVYAYFCRQHMLRCSTYDSIGKKGGGISFSFNGSQGHCLEIPYIMNHKLLSLNVIEKSIMEFEKYYSEKMGYAKLNFDILIPLNIMWDAAALNVPCIFSSSRQWLLDTLEYILNNTEATVLIKEHPGRKNALLFHYESIFEDIKKIKGYTEKRVYYAQWDDSVNVYECINGCKLVLPYTSTVGMEAVAMGKNVICCANAYYCQCGIGQYPKNKIEYFQKIKEGLLQVLSPIKEERIKSLLALALHSKMYINSDYNEINTEWSTIDFESMYRDLNIKKILMTIGEGVPFILQNIGI